MISAVWGGVDYRVTQPFTPKTHAGIDIGCPTGTTIYAARAGIVERVATGVVSVRVGNQRDFYLHGTPLVKVGQAIAVHQPVIKSGMVAVDPRYPPTGPHLHFECQNGYAYPAAPPYAWEAPLDPVPILLAAHGAASGQLTPPEDEVIYVGPHHDRPAKLSVFAGGAVYRERSITAPQLLALAKGASVVVDAYCYSTSGAPSTDLSGAAGAQVGTDFVWWHRTDATGGGWVPDAILDTRGLTPPPPPAIPAAEPLHSLFAVADELVGGGAAGPPGPAGPSGPQGPAGPKGEPGPAPKAATFTY